jgi:DNA-binding FadR family transcriptional regulator
MRFQPIEKLSAADECAVALRRAILAGELHAGERLPPERRLAEQFGVNRLTLRSALAQLSGVGLLTVKQGSGYTVADVARVGGPDLFPDILEMARERDELVTLVADLLDVRRSLARSVLGRLAACACAADLERIESAVDHFEALCNQTPADLLAFVEADLAIVAAMVDGTGSAVLRMSINPVILAVSQIRELAVAMYVDPRDNLAGHRLLLTWLRNPELATVDYIVGELEKRDRRTVERMSAPTLRTVP